MWDFIWHLRGSILLEETASNVAVLDRVEDLLRQRGIRFLQHAAMEHAVWQLAH